MNRCIVCNSPTANPKFCSRSCAAKHNNTVTPKRKPEGKCLKCGSPIITKEQYRKVCVEGIRAEQVRKADNIRKWRTVLGTWSEQPVQRVGVSKRTVFEVLVNIPPIEAHDPVGKLLDRLTGLCFSGLKYLRHEDAARHIALLQELKQFNCTIWGGVNRVSMKVESLPISDLGIALGDWIFSYFDDNRCALLPAYALDTAMFIEAHISGHYQMEPEPWEIKPIVPDIGRGSFGVDARFKSSFTSRFAATIVRCRVPQGSAIKVQQKNLISSGQEVCAVIKRCHLSSNFQNQTWLRTEAPTEETLDLGFEFIGEILLIGEGSLFDWLNDSEQYPIRTVLLPEAGQLFYNCYHMDLSFPGNWIHSAGRFDNGNIHLLPVPRWDAEIGEMRNSLIENSYSQSTQ
jgi:hypothetical protein